MVLDLDLSSLSELPTSEPAASLLSPSSAFSKSEITSNQIESSSPTRQRLNVQYKLFLQIIPVLEYSH